MSLVSAVAMHNFVSVVTDGRAIRNGVIVDEQCEKSIMPREKLVIGYTGIKEACEEIILSNEIDYKSDSLEVIIEKIARKVVGAQYSDARLGIIIAGINSGNAIQLSSISNFTANENLIPSGNVLKSAHAGGPKLHLLNTKYMKALEDWESDLKQIQTYEDVVRAQIKFNNSIADIDSSVNQVIQHIAFRK